MKVGDCGRNETRAARMRWRISLINICFTGEASVDTSLDDGGDMYSFSRLVWFYNKDRESMNVCRFGIFLALMHLAHGNAVMSDANVGEVRDGGILKVD